MKDSTRTDRNKKILLTGSSFIFIYLLFWLVYIIVGNSLAVPSPNQVFVTLFELFKTSTTYLAIFWTLYRLLVSLVLSFIIGLALGIISGIFKNVHYFLNPIISIFRTVPVASVIIIIILIATRMKSPYFVTALMLVPIIYQATYEGIRHIDKELMDVWRLDGDMSFLILRKAIIPLILPFLKTAFIQMVGLGFKVMVMAEFIAFVNNSIGKELISANQNIEPDKVFAWTIIIIVLVLLIEVLPKYIINFLNKIKLNKEKTTPIE